MVEPSPSHAALQYGGEYRQDSYRLLGGKSDAAIRFDDLCALLESLGFDKRVKGSHHLFRRAGIEERINLQRMAIRPKAE